MDRVRLGFLPGGGWACLRELSGAEEQAVTGTGTADAIRLLDGLLVASGGTAIAPGSATALTAADRDRLLAAVYIRTYGARIANTLRCVYCDALFDIDFSLEELLAYLSPQANDRGHGAETVDISAERLADGTFCLSDGTRFRLPTGEDECAVLGSPADQAEQVLLQCCLLDENLTDETGRDGLKEAVQAAMADVAPVLDLDLDAHCPECGRHQAVHFDIQHYLLSALQRERKQLAQEVHRLASAYGWSLTEILGLPRSQRRSLVALVESERSSRRGMIR